MQLIFESIGHQDGKYVMFLRDEAGKRYFRDGKKFKFYCLDEWDEKAEYYKEVQVTNILFKSLHK